MVGLLYQFKIIINYCDNLKVHFVTELMNHLYLKSDTLDDDSLNPILLRLINAGPRTDSRKIRPEKFVEVYDE